MSRTAAAVCDRLVLASILFLIFFTPLAFGSVHPWAATLMEAISFLLGILWAVRVLIQEHRPHPSLWGSLPVSASALLVGLACLQLLPMPPAVLKVISPATWQVYARSLPGWPGQIVYQRLRLDQRAQNDAPAIRPYASDDSNQPAGSQVGKAGRNAAQTGPPVVSSQIPRWRPLTLSPSLTLSQLWKLLAYATVFCVVAAYPFGRGLFPSRGSASFIRMAAVAVVISGLLIAAVGIVDCFTWNGKILWFMVPDDWGKPLSGMFPRASGPFVNPDHFANYLAMIFPMAVTGAFFPRVISSTGSRVLVQVLCALAVFTLCAAILLSLSRAGVAVAVSGIIFLYGFLLSLPHSKRPAVLDRNISRVFAGLVLCSAVLLALAFVGPPGRNQINARMNETVQNYGNLAGRGSLAADSVGMVRDFPLFGVGLGSWPEIFPRYQRPPFSETTFAREPENDYVEFLTEMGFIGAAVTAWILFRLTAVLKRSVGTVTAGFVPLFGALLAGVLAMGIHEFFDFSFQIPSNALLFTILLALAVRLASDAEEKSRARRRAHHFDAIFATCAPACLLAGLCWVRPVTFNIEEPNSAAEAVRLISGHPARANLHISLLQVFGSALTQEQVSNEIAAVLWLQPTNPYARDLHASMLIRQGRQAEGLNEVTTAVYYSPDLSTHFYLAPRFIHLLLPAERNAIEAGFHRAVGARFRDAVDGLGSYFHLLSRSGDEAKVYEAAAAWEGPFDRRRHLLDAGIAYSDAGEPAAAEKVLRQAAADNPRDPEPYRELALRVFAPGKRFGAAKTVLGEGISQGADKATLTAALADAADIAGTQAERNTALIKAVALEPGSYDLNLRLARSYLNLGNCDRAVNSALRAVELRPRAAEAYSWVGMAEEQCYQFDAAETAYRRAAQLQPSYEPYRQSMKDLERRIAENKPNSH